MTVELRPADAAQAGSLPFDEQTRLDVAAGRRRPFAVFKTQEGGASEFVGSAVLGRHELDLELRPEFRAQGLGGEAAERLLELAGAGPLTAWSHEDHPAARALAERFGFTAARELLKLAVPVMPPSSPPPVVETFRPGADDDEWVALNARIFAAHPEQGGITVADLRERMAEPWFDPADFLILREGGRMAGYCWVKLERGSVEGEIYVIGVDPHLAGRRLGSRLLAAGIHRIGTRRRRRAILYVDADNAPARALYARAGFAEVERHVQYRRP